MAKIGEKMDKIPVHLMDIEKLIGDLEKMRKKEVAYKRVAYALGAEAGLKPEDVDRAVNMAKADIEDELKFKETAPGLYAGNTIQNMAAESRDVAAKKGGPYIEKIRDDRNY